MRAFPDSSFWLRLGGALLSVLLAAGAAHAQLPDTLDLRPIKRNDLLSHRVVSEPGVPIVRFRIANMSPSSFYGQYTMRCRVDARPSHDTLVWVGIQGAGTSPAPDFYFQLRGQLRGLPLGRHTVKVWLDPPAGTLDPNRANDTLRYAIRVVPAHQSEPRLALIEDYTSTTCGPCGPTATALNTWLQASPQDTAAVVVAFQQDFPVPGCYYQNPSSVARRHSFSIVGVPYFMPNGASPVNISQFWLLNMYGEFFRPSFVHLDASYYRDPSSGKLTLWATVTPLADFEPNQQRPEITVAWIEPEVPAFRAINGQTVLHNVSHFVQTNWAATSLVLGAAGTTNVIAPATYLPDTADHVQDPTTLVPIVWVKSRFGPDGVLQAVRARRLSAPLGVAPSVSADVLSFGLTPNPARGSATLRVTLPTAQPVEVEVLDGLGRRVLISSVPARPAGAYAWPLDVRGLGPGVYAVRLTTGGHVATRRLVVE
ncbi:MAG: T9SS type A sorting domain-containing protein [Hymenobacteraceae bacterium]|nr:T9SS type A sorting domain-containing protein [Hymenobacteraceae bacterium]